MGKRLCLHPTLNRRLRRLVLRLRSRTWFRRFDGKGKGHVDTPGMGFGILAAACSNNHKLTLVHFIRGGSSVSGKGKRGLPQQLAGRFVVGTEFFVEIGCANE